jgi:hypothetical protein
LPLTACERPEPRHPGGEGPPRPRIGPPDLESGPTLHLPARPGSARAGSELVDHAIGLRLGEREAFFVEEALSGNVPDFLRRLAPVPLEAGALRGRAFVTPDYLALGSDKDWVRVPMTMRSARKIAHAAATVLPTTRIVDAVHASAALRISSPYMPPGRDMTSVDYFVAHHAAIEGRRLKANVKLGDLVSGPKKDLVLSRRALDAPGRCAIYGWFTDEGSVIQPLSLLHDDKYVDYAHGVRLVHEYIEVDGEPERLLDVLADKGRAALVSDEGRFDLRELWERGF